MNNNFPYRNPAPQSAPSYMGPFSQPTQTNDIKWVQGISGAKAFPVSAGSTVQLMDTEDSIFYIKSADYSGMPLPLRVFDYKERVDQAENPEFVTRAEFNELKKILEDLTGPVQSDH